LFLAVSAQTEAATKVNLPSEIASNKSIALIKDHDENGSERIDDRLESPKPKINVLEVLSGMGKAIQLLLNRDIKLASQTSVSLSIYCHLINVTLTR